MTQAIPLIWYGVFVILGLVVAGLIGRGVDSSNDHAAAAVSDHSECSGYPITHGCADMCPDCGKLIKGDSE